MSLCSQGLVRVDEKVSLLRNVLHRVALVHSRIRRSVVRGVHRVICVVSMGGVCGMRVFVIRVL